MDKRQIGIKIDRVIESDLPDIEKLAQTFNIYTSSYIENSANQIELLKAIKDEDSLIKERIKKGMMEIARSMFDDNYRRITGRSAWDE